MDAAVERFHRLPRTVTAPNAVSTRPPTKRSACADRVIAVSGETLNAYSAVTPTASPRIALTSGAADDHCRENRA